jgi:stage II sporulation protein D
MVQEVFFARPLRVRILLDERSLSQALTLRGDKLLVNGHPQQGSELNCKYASPKGWACKIGQKSFTGKIQLQSSEPFIYMDKAFYRDTLHLHPQGSKLLVINELDLESYLVGIVNSEISSKYPREAIKAQVIAARSYALARMERRKKSLPYDLDSTEMDQVYRGAQVEDAMSHFAVLETKGQVLVNNSKIVKAFYHASSGGALEKPDAVWGNSKFVDNDVYSTQAPIEAEDDSLKWSISFGPWIGLKVPSLGLLRDIKPIEYNPGGRVRRLLLIGDNGSQVIRASQMRQFFGTRWMKSTLFKIEQNGMKWTLRGKGFGHGVGMSQLGARKLAQKGWSYERILKAYYPGASLGVVSEKVANSTKVASMPAMELWDLPPSLVASNAEIEASLSDQKH